MSESGDVAWSDGRAWMRTAWTVKARWITRYQDAGISCSTLKKVKQHDDFTWLVKDGIPIVLNALAVYHALDSFADFVAKRGADAELTAERDELLSRLAEMTAQRDHAVEGVAAMTKLRDAELDDNRITWRQNKALREQLDKARGEKEKQVREQIQRKLDYAEKHHLVLRRQFDAIAEQNRSLTDAVHLHQKELVAMDAERNTAWRRGQKEERAAIVEWLRERAVPTWGDAVDYAGDIESGQHLGDDDE